MAFWQRVASILKSGSTMDDMVDLMVNGHGCVGRVIMDVGGEAKKGHAFFTMGTPAMLKKGWMSRFFGSVSFLSSRVGALWMTW